MGAALRTGQVVSHCLRVSTYRKAPLTGAAPRSFVSAVADRYRVEEEIGRGGWGLVYRAHDLRNNCSVAIKVLRPEFAGSVSGERFRREIEILSRLSHPNIVSLIDWGEADGSPWYSMPYVQGDNLRARLDREGQLAIEEAVGIARQVAEALAHAHAADVVHRDIKPGNILLEDGKVLVADFGIARAITTSVTGQFVSSSGVLIGTPAYMSPEQASAQREIDGRSDIYALGCVLYEMLAGEPPFNGPSPAAITARHVMDPVPPLSTVRSSVPESLARLVYRMLAKSPADRFATANDLLVVMDMVEKDPSISVADDRRGMRRWQRVSLAGAATVAMAVTGWSLTTKAETEAKLLAAADTTLLAVFPVERTSAAATLDADELLRQAVVRLQGVRVVGASALTERMRGRSSASLTATDTRDIALRLGAARYIRSSVVSSGGQLSAHAMLFDVGRGTAPLYETTEYLGGTGQREDSVFARLVMRLLVRADSSIPSREFLGTTSLPALQAFMRGNEALRRWNLIEADSGFTAAVRTDPKFARASLWLAISRLWAERKTPTWAFAVNAAAAGRSSLMPSEQEQLEAMVALLEKDVPRACAIWSRLAQRDSFDFGAWYGAGDCLSHDDAVLPDENSPSSWRFRSGYHTALSHYQRAFALRPTMLDGMRENGFERVRRLFKTSGNSLRTGRSQETPARRFFAYPSLEHDTLAFIPFTAESMGGGAASVMQRIPRSVNAAVTLQRHMLLDVASSWRSSDPGSIPAREAMALALSLLGDASALDTLRSARRVVTQPADSLRLATTEVWMLVQFSLPDHLTELRAARALADSLLALPRSRIADHHTMASIAALTGRAYAAAEIESAVRTGQAPSPDARLARALDIFAAFGGPDDSLRVLEQKLEQYSTGPDEASRSQVRSRLLGRAATLAFPSYRFQTLTSIPTAGDYLLEADVALVRGDTAAMRAALRRIRDGRRAYAPPELAVDALYPEAWLLAETGDVRGAIEWLDPTLRTLRFKASLIDPIRAATLVRTMALRAELAARAGDAREAEKWATAVLTLWANADTFLKPLLTRMRELARHP